MIRVECRDGGQWRAASASLHGVAAAAVLAWAASPGWAVAGLLVGVWAWRREGGVHAAGTEGPSLAWDGRGWQFDGVDVEPPAIVLDLGGWMLLALHGRPTRWAALSAAGVGPGWPAIRAGIYSTASPPSPEGPEPSRGP